MPPLAAFLFLALLSSGQGSVPAVQAAETPAYVAIGDSLAFGVGAVEPAKDGYVALVHDALRKSDRYRERGLELANLAVPGATTEDLLIPGGQLDSALEEIRSRTEDTSSADDNVEIISVNIGGNDLLSLTTADSPCVDDVSGDACLDRFGEVLASLQENLAEVLRQLREEAPQAGIYVLDLYNPYSGTGDERESVADLAVQQLNGVIGAITANDDLKVHMGTVFRLFHGRGTQWIAADGIHPNEKGHKVMAEVLLAVIDDRAPQIPVELLAEPLAPAASPTGGIPGLGKDGDSDIPWFVWVLVPLAFAAGGVVTGAYFWARGRT